MKKLKYLLLLCIVCNLAYSQDTLLTYYNQDWKKIDNKDYASFYRKSFKDSARAWAVRDYFVSGKIQMIGTFKTKYDKKKIGLFTFYFENGKKSSQGEYVKGLRVGKWTSWYENGELRSEGEYIKNQKSGPWQYWYENGAKESAGNFIKDKHDGEWTYWHENKRIQATGNYKNSLKEGLWIDYYENGQKKLEGTFKQGFSNGEFTYWYEDGELSSKGGFIRGHRDGVWKAWHKNGSLKLKEVYLNGLVTTSEGYHSNRKPYYSGNYKYGQRNGKWIFSNVSGRKYLEGVFSGGKHKGEWIRYFSEGEMKLFYVNGILKNKKMGGLIGPRRE